jgi:hypothetical protein
MWRPGQRVAQPTGLAGVGALGGAAPQRHRTAHRGGCRGGGGGRAQRGTHRRATSPPSATRGAASPPAAAAATHTATAASGARPHRAAAASGHRAWPPPHPCACPCRPWLPQQCCCRLRPGQEVAGVAVAAAAAAAGVGVQQHPLLQQLRVRALQLGAAKPAAGIAGARMGRGGGGVGGGGGGRASGRLCTAGAEQHQQQQQGESVKGTSRPLAGPAVVGQHTWGRRQELHLLPHPGAMPRQHTLGQHLTTRLARGNTQLPPPPL